MNVVNGRYWCNKHTEVVQGAKAFKVCLIKGCPFLRVSDTGTWVIEGKDGECRVRVNRNRRTRR